MTFPSNPVEETLLGLRLGRLSGDRLLDALAEADLWVPLPDGASDDAGRLPVMLIEDAPYVAVYTSEEQFGIGAGNMGCAVAPGREFARALSPELGLAVNPGCEVGLPIGPAALPAVRGEGRPVPAGTRIALGEPADEPVALLQALRDAVAEVPEVSSARRAWAVIDDVEGSLIIGIALDRKDEPTRKTVLDAVAHAGRKSHVPFAVDSVFLDDQGDPLAAWLMENTEPFYERPAPEGSGAGGRA